MAQHKAQEVSTSKNSLVELSKVTKYVLIIQDIEGRWEVVSEQTSLKDAEKKAKGFIQRETAQQVRILLEKKILKSS